MNEISGMELLGRLVPALTVVVAAPLAVRRMMRRTRGPGVPPALRVVERTPMARAAHLVVVEADGRRLLLGVTESRVTLIAELDPASPTPQPITSGTEARNSRPRTGLLDRWQQLTLRRPARETVRVLHL